MNEPDVASVTVMLVTGMAVIAIIAVFAAVIAVAIVIAVTAVAGKGKEEKVEGNFEKRKNGKMPSSLGSPSKRRAHLEFPLKKV